MNSMRVFLVAVILATITLTNFVIALRGYDSSMLEADRLFDKQLLDTAKLIANIHAEKLAENIDQSSNLAFQVWDRDQLIAASSNTPATAIADLRPGFDYNNFGGYRWRTVTYQDSHNGYWVLAAERTDLRYILAENVILQSIYPILLGLPLIGLLIWFIVSRGLKPLQELADELANKQPGDLSPLSIRAPKQELKQIVASCNGLLERLETSTLREKQFASDAAHELRTPISALKVQLYNLAKDLPEDDEELGELMQTSQQLEHIVEQILDLYRSSSDRYHATFSTIDLTALTQEVLAQLYEEFDRKNQQLEFHGDTCHICGDRFALTTLLSNLLRNANKYTPAGGSVLVSIREDADRVELVIEDSGPGIPADQRQAVFDRFYRIGGDRHPSGEPGCGLGLAIVKHIVDLHNASIAIESSRFATGAAFRIRFARDPDAKSSIGHEFLPSSS